VTNRYDTFLRRTNLSLLYSPSTLQTINFGYDSASRLQAVSDGTNSATYSYLANSPLVDHVLFTNNGVFRMARTNRYDYLKRLLSVTNRPAGGSPIASVYGYNAASQRTSLTNDASERWDFRYDYLGQVTNGWKYDSGGQVINDHRFAYFFDDIGNRKQTVTNGTTINYAANLLNQYTNVGGWALTNDADGNLTADLRCQYGWDAENRLVAVTNGSLRLSLTYDWEGRRIRKVVSVVDVPISTNSFIYDGWNLIAVLGPQPSVLESFTWGTDLSGTLQGGGGVGGLLSVTYRGTQTTNCFAAYDGNGNVVALVNGADASIAAQYEYGPFGEVLRATGPMARANPFRFSTKYQDDETDLLYYGYRYLSTSSGRWLSRDPLGEKWGGKNLYAALSNDPLSKTDSLGLLIIGNPAFCYECRCKKVNLGPVGPVEAFSADGIKTPNVSIGPAIPRSFDTEGMLAPHLCKCKYRDSGHSTTIVNGDKRERDFRTFDKPYREKEIPCTADVDYPGLKLEGLPPDAPLDIDLTVNMTVTAICDGTDGSHAEASVPVRYHFKQHITGPSK